MIKFFLSALMFFLTYCVLKGRLEPALGFGDMATMIILLILGVYLFVSFTRDISGKRRQKISGNYKRQDI